jgi:hypothetical protein
MSIPVVIQTGDMHLIKNTTAIFLMFWLIGCIKAYDPVIDASAANKYVVSGRITGTEGWQDVEVSLSSPVESSEYIPVSGCTGRILDDKGNNFPLTESGAGRYRAWMRQIDLMPGTSYRVQISTPDGEELESGFDQLLKCPPIDSVYYLINDMPTPDPGMNHKVMQFYVDVNAAGDYSQYYKWEIEETWEYHAAHPAQYYYDGTLHEIIPPDYTNNVCWVTVPVRNVFTVSTKNLAQNSYKKYPLQYVDGQSARLAFGYSILVSQYALSEGAYNYWEKLRVNSNEQGGLYEKQPVAIKGNVLNLSNPEKDVLGYFYAVSVSSRRYFYHDVEGIELDYYNGCSEEPLGKFGWKEIFPWEYPVYYYFNEHGFLLLLGIECVDCRRSGGTIVKPDFWPY